MNRLNRTTTKIVSDESEVKIVDGNQVTTRTVVTETTKTADQVTQEAVALDAQITRLQAQKVVVDQAVAAVRIINAD